MQAKLIVHGGAGDWPDAEDNSILEGMREAVEAGRAVLMRGGSALDAVEQATHVLEDHPLLDAGRGSFLNRDGVVQMDALIIDASNDTFGAVAGIEHVQHAISLARYVMEHTPHHFVIGAGAEALLGAAGLARIPNIKLVTAQRWQEWQAQRDAAPYALSDTVGAVALDVDGKIAVATSTGGTNDKLPGRVGDSPIFGAGGYAEPAWGGVSATGRGEQIMRTLLSKYAVDRLADGLVAQAAVDSSIAYLRRRTPESPAAGLIMLDAQGHYGWGHSTPKMSIGWLDEDGHIQAVIGGKAG